MNDEILTTRSRKWGERKWKHVGEREHVTNDGRSVTLKVWRGSCVKCGAQYDVASTGGLESRAFGVVHCRAHRGKAPRHASRPRLAGRTAARRRGTRPVRVGSAAASWLLTSTSPST